MDRTACGPVSRPGEVPGTGPPASLKGAIQKTFGAVPAGFSAEIWASQIWPPLTLPVGPVG